MASTDTRSGFRLPWSSDRSHEDTAPETAAEATTEPADAAPDADRPQGDVDATRVLDGDDQHPLEADGTATPDAEEPGTMVELDTAVAPTPATPAKKPSKLMADLTAAIRATAESAREQSLAQVDADVKQVVDSIRERSTEGAANLKHQSEEDIAAIREWSKAEIARIREETEARITGRKATLEEQLAGHAAAVERRVDEVRAELARFERDMEAYVERLLREDDPARLATMAETLPESPSFEAWADLATLDITLVPEPEVAPEPEPVAAADEPQASEAQADDNDPWAPDPDAIAAALDRWAPAPEPIAATIQPEAAIEAVAPEAIATADEADTASAPARVSEWGDSSGAWGGGAPASTDTADAADDDVPRWAAGDTPDGFPADDADGGDPVDRGAIMAALEAAAEAVVAAEAAAESADQAEAAADVAETAAELLVGRTGPEDDLDPGAQAAMDARMDAGGFDTESFADRLASLLPGHGEGAADDEPRTTQVVVMGLVSVASIASFKRHLGRLPGVQTVAVASGPEGEFVFNLTHRADLSFRDSIPTMPGFAARVTSTGDGVVHVTARDPEAEA